MAKLMVALCGGAFCVLTLYLRVFNPENRAAATATLALAVACFLVSLKWTRTSGGPTPHRRRRTWRRRPAAIPTARPAGAMSFNPDTGPEPGTVELVSCYLAVWVLLMMLAGPWWGTMLALLVGMGLVYRAETDDDLDDWDE